ncbi:MAG: HEPN domain-containing protein [Flavisolibacter sp.]|nr:HEPN domain-containing protein [Flavisolibacter sp.]
MKSPHHNEALKALNKAKDSLESAAYNVEGGFELAAVNRAYYTCYYCMTALLYLVNAYAKTHQGTHAKFSELYIRTGTFPATTSEIISLLFEQRQAADYNLNADFTADEAEALVEKAGLSLS